MSSAVQSLRYLRFVFRMGDVREAKRVMCFVRCFYVLVIKLASRRPGITSLQSREDGACLSVLQGAGRIATHWVTQKACVCCLLPFFFVVGFF